MQVDLNQKIKADPQGKLVLYNDTIAQKYKGYLMTTKAAKYSVRIYAGDQLIYQYSDSNFHRNDQMKSKLSCDARIPEQGKKGTVIKIIYQNGSNGIYDLDDILVGRGDVVMGFMFNRNSWYRDDRDHVFLKFCSFDHWNLSEAF